MREIKLKDLKQKSPTELLAFAEENEVENASIMRKQELMFAILKQLASMDVEIIGEGVVEILQDGFAFLRSADANYLPGPGRHLCLALANPAPQPAHRRHRRRRHPQPEGGRALFRAAQGQSDQFRGPGKSAPQGPFRQSDAALSRRASEARDRRSHEKGPFRPGDRHRLADRQGPARADRRAAAHRQDGAAAEHRAIGHRQSSRMLSDRAADRRAPRGSHRHAALGEGRGRVLDLRRTGGAPRPGRRNGHRKGQAAGRAWPRRGHPAGFHHPARARLQHGGAFLGQGADRRRRRQRPAAAQALFRRRAQYRGRRLADHHRDRPDRYRARAWTK